MPKKNEKTLPTDVIPAPLLSAMITFRDRFVGSYKFKILSVEPIKDDNGDVTWQIVMCSSGSRDAMLNRQIYTTRGQSVREQWLRTLAVSVTEKYVRIENIGKPRHSVWEGGMLHDELKKAVRSMLDKKHGYVLTSVDVERDGSGGG